MFIFKHLAGNVWGELFNLYTYVFEEAVTFPSSYEVDGGVANVCEFYRHGAAWSDGVGTNFVWFKSKISVVHVFDCFSEEIDAVFAADLV